MINTMLKSLLKEASSSNNVTSNNTASKTKEELKRERVKKREESKRLAKEKAESIAFYNAWVKEMGYLKIKNELSETFALRNITHEPYGFSCEIHAPIGLTTKILDKQDIIDVLQNNLGCLFQLKHLPKKNYSIAKFITKDIPSIDFKPLKLSPYEIYLSTGIDGQPMTSSMIKYPHALVQGSTGSGKTKFIDLILTNLISTETMQDVSIYIAQADKADQIIYRKCEHCQGYADTLEQIFGMLVYLTDILEKRKEILKPFMEDGVAENIFEYNKAIDDGKIIGMKKWKYMYLVIDEYASLMPDGEYNKTTKETKQAIQSMMERILQIARYAGLFAIVSTQRATIDKMPSFIKAMCNTIVTFRVNNRKSSEVAIDSGDAVNLKQREFISKTEEVCFGRTVNLTQPSIHNWIKPYKLSSPIFTDFLSCGSEKLDLINNKGKKNGKGRKNKSERRESKINVNKDKVSQDEAVKKANDIIKSEKSVIKNTVENQSFIPAPVPDKPKSNLDKFNKSPKSEFFIEGWVDPLSNPNINIVDKTKLPTNTQKPKK